MNPKSRQISGLFITTYEEVLLLNWHIFGHFSPPRND